MVRAGVVCVHRPTIRRLWDRILFWEKHMSLRNTAVARDYDPDPLRWAIPVLERQLANTLDLAAHVERLRTELAADADGKTRSLLEGLSDELDACCTLFTDRIESFAPVLQQPQQIEASRHSD